MTLVGRALLPLQLLSALLITAGVLVGYLVSYGYLGMNQHVLYGFLSALVIAFTHAMTIFYLAGTGVSMREASSGRTSFGPLLLAGAALRRRMALPLGLAIVTLMATVIAGGGAHTRRLPSMAHHGLALAAMVINLLTNALAIRVIRANERLIAQIDARLKRGE